MKLINIGVTLSFIIVFAVATINIDSFLYLETASSVSPSPPAYYKNLPMSKIPPFTAEIIPPEKETKQFYSIVNNEYFKGVSGAAIGWVVKGICEWLFSSTRKLMGAIRFRRG
jgi:hypothetical protein